MLRNKYCVAFTVLVLTALFTQVAFSQEKKSFTESQMRIIKQLKEKGDEAAIKSAEEYLASNPNDVDITNLLGEIYINNHDLTKAEAVVKRAISLDPNNSWSRRILARVYRLRAEIMPSTAKENLALALEQVKKGLGTSPNDPKLLAEAAEIYNGMGDKTKANESIDLAISIKPSDTSLRELKTSIATGTKWGKAEPKK